MGVRIVEDLPEGIACMYDSVSETAFGPIFHDSRRGFTAKEEIVMFLVWLQEHDERDVRAMPENTLMYLYNEWFEERYGEAGN